MNRLLGIRDVPRVVGHLRGASGHILILGFHGLGRQRRGAGRAAHYDYERATARRGRLPESLGCTTDYRHETGAPRRTPPRSGRPARPRPASPAPPPHRFIHSVHNYSYGEHDGREQRAGSTTWARSTCSCPPSTPARSRCRPARAQSTPTARLHAPPPPIHPTSKLYRN